MIYFRKILPDPRDGSLYMNVSNHERRDWKKLRYSISELIYRAPLRTPDGLLYTGKYWSYIIYHVSFIIILIFTVINITQRYILLKIHIIFYFSVLSSNIERICSS